MPPRLQKFHVRRRYDRFMPHRSRETLCGLRIYVKCVAYHEEMDEFYRLDNYKNVPIDTICGHCVRICQGYKRYRKKGS